MSKLTKRQIKIANLLDELIELAQEEWGVEYESYAVCPKYYEIYKGEDSCYNANHKNTYTYCPEHGLKMEKILPKKYEGWYRKVEDMLYTKVTQFDEETDNV